MKLSGLGLLVTLGAVIFIDYSSCESEREKRFFFPKGIDWSKFFNFWKKSQNDQTVTLDRTNVDCNEVTCFLDPCQVASCPGQTDADCRTNNCGTCKAEFFLNDVKLSDDDCSE
ncbi:hypothetical protein RRG08_031866 [Elysia crispata]|uniref:Uncharacterized protein n=1 Tax=Elysia crispata TaxID=231223 RepID=A0AAE1DZT5_9GAST|nr:hypothetical protein RRG08_031866 [Elysia crispata]